MNNHLNQGLLYTQRIKAVYHELRASEKKIADYVMENPAEVLQDSMSELSGKVGVSEPSLLRFVRAAGYEGFSDFKLNLAKDMGEIRMRKQPPLDEISILPDDDMHSICSKIISHTKRGLDEILSTLDSDELDRAVKAIIAARRVEIYGVGNSGVIADDIMHKLMRLGITSRSFSDPHMQILSACNLTDKDVVIAVSHSGKTGDIINALKTAKESGAATIVITNYRAAEILQLADISLLTGEYETSYYSESMISRVAQMSIIDMIYTGILLSDYEGYSDKINYFHTQIACKQI